MCSSRHDTPTDMRRCSSCKIPIAKPLLVCSEECGRETLAAARRLIPCDRGCGRVVDPKYENAVCEFCQIEELDIPEGERQTWPDLTWAAIERRIGG